MRINDSNSIGNDNDLGEHYGNVNSKQLLWTTLNMISQNNFTHWILFYTEILSSGQFYWCIRGYKCEVFGE